MKIIIDVPDWAKERNIYILAGVEGLAVKRFNEDFVRVKTERCNWCGECCKYPNISSAFPLGEKGECIYLEQKGPQNVCTQGVERPRVCCYSDPVVSEKANAEEWCSIRYKKVPIE